jgi:putative ABC transport system substrate-binding protein
MPVRRRELLIALGGGAVVVWPMTVLAQQKPMPVIGFLNSGTPGTYAPLVSAFRQGLTETGYVEGQNVALEYRWAEGNYDRLPAMAADLVAHGVDVIAALGGPSGIAAKRATSTIPIVFTGGIDPVATGLVASLARPGGNVTGINFLFVDMHPKRLELLCELVPQARVIALLVNPSFPGAERTIEVVQEAARGRGVKVIVVTARREGDIDAAFATLVDQAGALIVGSDPFFGSQREQLVALASRHAIPAIYTERGFTEAGGLLSYGANLSVTARQAGIFVGKILKGAKPSDLPVEQPTRFELVINLKTAKALGLLVPQSLLARVDEVIE